MLKVELQRAEGELEDRCWSPPPGLQHWLQLTHEIENKAYTKKKISAEKQLQQAREAVSHTFFLNYIIFVYHYNSIIYHLIVCNVISSARNYEKNDRV